jgi:hypothetical protein
MHRKKINLNSLCPFSTKTLSVCLSFIFSQFAMAGFGTSLMQTANVTDPGQYEIKAQGDIIFVDQGGFNFSPHFVTGIIEHYLDVDFFLGTGTTDFQIGSQFKYNLLPDLPEQFGLSFLFGASFLRDEAANFLLLGFSVLSSKEYNTSFGSLSPYVGFQFEGFFNAADDSSKVPLTVLLGAKASFKDYKDYAFFTELGIGVHESNTYVGLGASYAF